MNRRCLKNFPRKLKRGFVYQLPGNSIQGFETEILAASIRNSNHIVQCAEAGADVCTCPLDSILGLLKHPLTDIGLEKFLADAKKLNF